MDFKAYQHRCGREGWFDAGWYFDQLLASGQPWPGNGLTLFEHFCAVGHALGLDPSPAFSVSAYCRLNPDVGRAGIDPLYHFLTQGQAEGRRWQQAVEPDEQIKPIAFYLPQFHPIPENDASWGTGFTEWTNVTRAQPLFPGHLQPRLPSELGFYDLRVPEVMHQQLQLAREHRVHGFCFYYYWFNGRRLLEKPLDRWLADRSLDMPFCVCWANENWSRRWDGMESEIIVGQEHTPLTDYRIIHDLLPLFADPRYIRVGGKPMMLVYRSDLLADARRTFDEWRVVAAQAGLGGLYIAGVRFHTTEAQAFGLDALVEFPPHHFAAPRLDALALRQLGVAEDFSGKVMDFAAGVDAAVVGGAPVTDAPLLPGVMPSWDNTARRGKAATVFHGDSPQLFAFWLADAIDRARALPPPLSPLLFVNAWNEWAEGTCLEPGATYGRRNLQILAVLCKPLSPARDALLSLRAVLRASSASTRPLALLVSHDAHLGGAQILLLRLLRSLKHNHVLDVAVVLLRGGPLRSEFEELASVLCIDDLAELGWDQATALQFVAERLRPLGDVCALTNTVATADAVPVLERAGLRCLSYLHELPTSIAMYGFAERIEQIRNWATQTVVVSDFVRRELSRSYRWPLADLDVVYTGLNEPSPPRRDRAAVLANLGLPADARLIVGCGAIHPRKGVDLFVQVAAQVCRLAPDLELRFVWLGSDQAESATRQWAIHDAVQFGLGERMRFAGQVGEVADVLAAADALLLSSREDPFPLVVLEAIEVGTPVVCFEAAGGAPEIVQRGAGLCVPYLDVAAAADAVLQLVADPALREAVRVADADLRTEFSWAGYVAEFERRLLAIGASGRARRQGTAARIRQQVAEDLCVVIPSYNHARYIEEALDSVLAQSWRPAEIRIIDDGSTDSSPELLQRLRLARYGVSVHCRENRGAHATINEGIERSHCRFVAILNSDDRFHPQRFERTLPLLRAEGGPALLFTRVCFFDNDGHRGGYNDWYEGGIRDALAGDVPLWLALLARNFFMTTSNLIASRAALLELGGFRAYRYSHDVDLLARACLRGYPVHFEQTTLCDYRFHASNTIRENAIRLSTEDAFLVADALRSFQPQLSPLQLQRLLRAADEKQISSQLLAFLDAPQLLDKPFDYRDQYDDLQFALTVKRALQDAPTPDGLNDALARLLDAAVTGEPGSALKEWG